MSSLATLRLLAKIAWRNIVRNRRRSLMTASAIAVGALAMLLFAGYTNHISAGMETGFVQEEGHLAIFRRGYFLYGAGNPAAYGIDDYEAAKRLIEHDPVLRPMIVVITPTQSLVGIAANDSTDNAASRTFIGIGLIPSDRDRMREWDEYGIGDAQPPDRRLSDADINRGLIGAGLARILGLCGPLTLSGCPPAPAKPDAKRGTGVDRQITDLAQRALGPASSSKPARNAPRIDLLAATAGGAPNVVSLTVAGAVNMGAKELDDAYVMMNLKLAQDLVYGRAPHKVTALVVQLKRTEQIAAARRRLDALFRQHHLALEVRDFTQLSPYYGQVMGLFRSIFLFISLVMGMIVLFAVVNTMTMNVVERINEIGTLRAMGVRRGRLRWQFVIEGMLIGMVGATIGIALALLVAALVDRAGITWIPPGYTTRVPLGLDVLSAFIIVGTWAGLVLVATIAALIPANRAARLPVVDALRHV